MKNFDFQISTEIFVLSLTEPILTIFGMTSVMCVADVRMFVSCISQKRLVVKY
ncbi:hypothetical protein O3M35_005709 [Rhynocoris fuscipes]|uniref:Uncharacterized protein n=1 Tax=Rhynocoris fuscipes TaxID=488301 RepID=A0AAW1DJ53_9HEMI